MSITISGGYVILVFALGIMLGQGNAKRLLRRCPHCGRWHRKK